MSMFSMIFWFDMSDDSFFMREEFATSAIIIIAAATPTIIGKYFFVIIKNAWFSPIGLHKKCCYDEPLYKIKYSSGFFLFFFAFSAS